MLSIKVGNAFNRKPVRDISPSLTRLPVLNCGYKRDVHASAATDESSSPRLSVNPFCKLLGIFQNENLKAQLAAREREVAELRAARKGDAIKYFFGVVLVVAALIMFLRLLLLGHL